MAAVPLRAQQLAFNFDPRQTQIEFLLGATFHTVHGTFALKSGYASFDPVTGKATGQIIVDAASGNSGNDGRDAEMHLKVLESSRFPEIVFLPDRIEGQVPAQGDFRIKVHGIFRLHGSDHETSLDVQAHRSAEGIGLTLQFPVPYAQWGLKNPSKLFLRVSDRVQVTIRTFALAASAPAVALHLQIGSRGYSRSLAPVVLGYGATWERGMTGGERAVAVANARSEVLVAVFSGVMETCVLGLGEEIRMAL
jgi:polyisoprenoid-binding protein YceI